MHVFLAEGTSWTDWVVPTRRGFHALSAPNTAVWRSCAQTHVLQQTYGPTAKSSTARGMTGCATVILMRVVIATTTVQPLATAMIRSSNFCYSQRKEGAKMSNRLLCNCASCMCSGPQLCLIKQSIHIYKICSDGITFKSLSHIGSWEDTHLAVSFLLSSFLPSPLSLLIVTFVCLSNILM